MKPLTVALMAADVVGALLVPTLAARLLNEGTAAMSFHTMTMTALQMLAVSLVSGCCAIGAGYCCSVLAARVAKDMRDAIYVKSLDLSVFDFRRFGTASMVTRTMSDVVNIQVAITNVIMMLLPVPFIFVVSLTFAFGMDTTLAWWLVDAMAFLALVAIKAMASSPWAVFSLGMTIPIALIMGCYERFLRPGRVIETTILDFVLLVLAIVGGGMIAANPVLAPIFTLNAKQLVVALVLYSFAAAALPHWLLVTPRDYLSTLMKIGTLALLVIGVVIANPQVQVPALTTLASRSNGPTFSGNLFPFLFITIACGALSGFHGAVSSGLTPKAIEKENQIRMIGYGSMLVESFTAIIALIAAVTISQGVYFSMNMSPSQIEATAGSAYSASASPEQNAAAAVSRMDVQNIEGQRMRVEWQSDGTVYTGAEALDAADHDVGEETLVSRTGGATTFTIGMANFLRSYLGGEESMAFWYHFAIMFEALFILTTVDNGTRVARYQIGDLLGNVRRLRKFADPTWRPGNLITTFVATALWGTMLYMGVSDANGGINAMVPIFGISNQLLSAGCFMLVTVCVVKAGLGQYAWIPVVPLVWDVAVTFTADFEKIFDPQLGYFATASSLRASIDSGQLEGEALATAYASLSNAYLDGVLSVFFLVMMAAFLAVGLKTIVATVRARAYGDHLTSQEPFLESNWFAPSGLIATRLERKVQREFEQHHARRAELG